MRIGVMIGPERGRYSTKVDRLRRDARWAEDSGFTTIWVPQIPDEFDALTAAAVMGAETERIEISTGVGARSVTSSGMCTRNESFSTSIVPGPASAASSTSSWSRMVAIGRS